MSVLWISFSVIEVVPSRFHKSIEMSSESDIRLKRRAWLCLSATSLMEGDVETSLTFLKDGLKIALTPTRTRSSTTDQSSSSIDMEVIEEARDVFRIIDEPLVNKLAHSAARQV